MHHFKFICDNKRFDITASSLSDAIQSLPPWTKQPPVELSVISEPIERETDYWRARALELETHLREVLQQ